MCQVFLYKLKLINPIPLEQDFSPSIITNLLDSVPQCSYGSTVELLPVYYDLRELSSTIWFCVSVWQIVSSITAVTAVHLLTNHSCDLFFDPFVGLSLDPSSSFRFDPSDCFPFDPSVSVFLGITHAMFCSPFDTFFGNNFSNCDKCFFRSESQ